MSRISTATLFTAAASTIALAGCAGNAAQQQPTEPKAASAPAPQQAPAAQAPRSSTSSAASKSMEMCRANFTTDGAYLRGYRFRTNTVVSGAPKRKIFANLAAATAEEGWIITSSDANVGTLSANHTRVHVGKTLTQVMSYSVLPSRKDVKVALTLNTPADIFGSGRNEDTLKQQMCEAIEKAAR